VEEIVSPDKIDRDGQHQGAIILRDRLGAAAEAAAPLPNRVFPDSAPPIFHWLA